MLQGFSKWEKSDGLVHCSV